MRSTRFRRQVASKSPLQSTGARPDWLAPVLAAAAAFGLIASLWVGTAPANELTGERFPPFAANIMQGDISHPDALAGDIVYIDVWASWCPPCLQALPALQTLQDEYGTTGFQVLGINVDTNQTKAKALIERSGVRYPNVTGLSDDDLRQLGIKGMPMGYLLDRSGTVRLTHEGFRQSDIDKLRSAISVLLQEDNT